MATKQKSKKKSGKQPPNKMAKNSKRKGASAKKAQKRTTATTKAPNKKAMQTKPSARETAARKKAATASKRPRGNREIIETVGDLAEVKFTLEIPCIRLRTFEGLPTMVAAFTTDIPALSNWGHPILVGPGSIHVAHTPNEYVEKKQLHEAVELYSAIASQLTK